MGEEEGRIIRENNIETCTLPYVKETASESLMYGSGHPKLVLCDNLEGWSGEGGGRGFRTEGTHAYLWLIHTDVWQNHDNSVK